MKVKEFRIMIESIGFKLNDLGLYEYEEFRIYLWKDVYNFQNGSKWYEHNYNDLTLIDEHFKKELRSIKLKSLLYRSIS